VVAWGPLFWSRIQDGEGSTGGLTKKNLGAKIFHNIKDSRWKFHRLANKFGSMKEQHHDFHESFGNHLFYIFLRLPFF